jgi:hypothetical protein
MEHANEHPGAINEENFLTGYVKNQLLMKDCALWS